MVRFVNVTGLRELVALCVAVGVAGCTSAPGLSPAATAGSPVTHSPSPAAPDSTPSSGLPSTGPTAVVGSPGPAGTATLAPSMTLAPTAGATPHVPATPTAAVLPTDQPPSPSQQPSEPVAWSPVRLVSDPDFFAYPDIAITTDDAGRAHVAAGSREGIVYGTNSGGGWRFETITNARAGGYDGQPSIAFDDTGALVVAFARFRAWNCEAFGCTAGDPIGIRVAERLDGGWSDVSPIADGPGYYPSLASHDGAWHVAYVIDGGARDGTYLARRSDATWTRELVAGGGDTPRLLVGPDGALHVVFDVYDIDSGDFLLRHAVRADDGSFAVEPGPAVGFYSWPAFFADLGPAGALHVVAANGYRALVSGEWTEPVSIFEDDDTGVVAGGVAVGDDETVHVVSYASNCGPIRYASGVDGAFTTRALTSFDVGCSADGPVVTQAIAVDRLGRAHIAFTVLGEDAAELWYVRGE